MTFRFDAKLSVYIPIAFSTWGVALQESYWRTGWFPETQQPESQENSGFKSPLSLSGRLGAAF